MVLYAVLDAIYDLCLLATGHIGCMETFKEVFEGGFIRLDLFIFLRLIGLVLLRMMVEDLFRLIVKCRKRQVVAKVRVVNMALKLVASSKVILD